MAQMKNNDGESISHFFEAKSQMERAMSFKLKKHGNIVLYIKVTTASITQ